MAKRCGFRATAFDRVAVVLVALASCGAAAAGSNDRPAPTLRILSTDPVQPVPVSIEAGLRPAPAFEAPPVIVAGAPGFFFTSTGWSWLCRAATPAVAAIKVDDAACRRFSVPDQIDEATGRYVSAAEAAARPMDWGRSYLGAFSALKLPHPWRGYDALAVMHGENKNEKVGAEVYANSVNPDVDPKACRSGYTGAAYAECYAAYSGFVSARLLSTATTRPALDLGPVLWSTMPYRGAGGAKTSYGLRHPSAIADGGFVYIFYTDGAQSPEIGRRAGLHVARMAIPTDDAGSFGPAVPFSDGAFRGESLPPGFAKDRIRDFYARAGSPASELWPDSWQTSRFAVSRVQGRHAFVGVEWFSAGAVSDLRLRASDDLVHWSAPVPIPGARGETGWSSGPMLYPVLTSLMGDSAEIDPSGFYLFGSLPDGRHVVRQRISISIGDGP